METRELASLAEHYFTAPDSYRADGAFAITTEDEFAAAWEGAFPDEASLERPDIDFSTHQVTAVQWNCGGCIIPCSVFDGLTLGADGVLYGQVRSCGAGRCDYAEIHAEVWETPILPVDVCTRKADDCPESG